MRFPLLALIFAAALGAAGAGAQTRVAPQSRQDLQLSFAPVVQRVAPAVVNVYGARVERRQQYMDDFFRRFFGEGGPGMPRERMQRSLGSGVIIDPSGLVVTNHHVIENMTEVRVSLADRREFEAEIVLRDQRTDLAVLRLKGAANLAAVEFGDSEALQVGDIVLAIGNPFGVGQTVTQGIVSALARTQVGITDYQFFIQTDAAINPGNSGGALIDIHGRLIGINTAIYSRSGGSQGIGFAIPSSMARAVAESARAGSRTVRRPWLGARLQSVDRDLAESIGLERPAGVLVSAVYDKGPASEAGLRRNDVILEVDGQNVDDPDAFGYRFALKGLAGQTSLTVLRGGKRTTLHVKLQSPPETRPREPVKIRGRSPFGGATAMNMSPAVADELQLDATMDGVVIADIDEGSAAGRVGFRKGDLILAINGERVNTSKDLERILRGGSQLWRITINRGGQVITSVLGG
ncbi:MAG TPA: DegQ family serine endoprotease [Beijerinckiaceae bacterium]|jgi:Do/DeqQ family serine protease